MRTVGIPHHHADRQGTQLKKRLNKALRLGLVGLWCLLCVALLALWVRSRTWQDQFVYGRKGGRLWQLLCHRDELAFSTATPWPNHERPQFFSIKDYGDLPLAGPVWWSGGGVPDSEWEFLGLHVISGPGQMPLNPDGTASWKRTITFPSFVTRIPPTTRRVPRIISTAPIRFVDVYISFWLPAILLASFPATLAMRRIRRAQRLQWIRQHAGLCPDCGYDLRATPQAGGALFDRCPECGRDTGRASEANSENDGDGRDGANP